MFGNNSTPPNMRFPPPPPFFPMPPIINPSFPPPPWPPAPPMNHQPPPPWGTPFDQQRLRCPGENVYRIERPGDTGVNATSSISQNIHGKPVKGQAETDKEWIADFLQRCSGGKSLPKKEIIKLSEAKRLHLKAYKLLQILEDGITSESSANTALTSNTKKELDEILNVLGDGNYQRKVAAAALRRKRRRVRNKSKRKEEFIRKVDIENRIKEKHVMVDKWLEERKKVEDDLKRERQVRKDLDEYLSDIRQKQQTAKKYLDLFNAMSKLRKARCETAARKGQSPPSEAHNDIFKTAHNSACKEIREFISKCKSEENFMRKYLTEEHEAEERRIQEEVRKEKENKILKWKNERSQNLFGAEADLDPSDPMWPVQEIHRHGSRSIAGLINVRTQWDQFISDAGTVIPSHWVEPSLPSTDDWRSYLAES